MNNKTKTSKGMSVQTRLTWFVTVLLLVVVFGMGLTVYQVMSSELTQQAEFQLQGHVSSVSKQVGILLQTTDSREFEQDMHYYLQGERKQLQTLGWTVQSDLLKPDGTSGLSTKAALTLSPALSKQMLATQSGILHAGTGNAATTYAYRFIPERSQLYVAAVPDSQIFAPLTRIRNVTLLVIAFALLIGLIGTRFITRRIVKPLVTIQTMMQSVAAGDLTQRLPHFKGMREITLLGRSVNSTVEQLRGLIQQVSSTAGQVADSSTELLHSAEQTSEGIRQVAATVQEVAGVVEQQANGAVQNASALEEMTVGLQRIVQASGTVAAASTNTAQEAEHGNEAVQQAVLQMKSISTKVERMAQAIKLLEQRSSEVGKIVEVIGGIAEQTTLLALNAAIEAARAGEQGRGFAVVADEVRKLAEQSEQSAKQIASLIHEIGLDTTAAVHAMVEGTQEVEAGLVVVDAAGHAFQRILQGAGEVAEGIQGISSASQQMYRQAEQVILSVDELRESSKQSAASSQFCAAASVTQLASMDEVFASVDSLSRMAHELQETIGRFVI